MLFLITSLPCSNFHLISIHIIADANACVDQHKASVLCGVVPVLFVLFSYILFKKKVK